MQITKIVVVVFFVYLICPVYCFSQITDVEGIKWLSFEEAIELQKTSPRKILVYCYFTECATCEEDTKKKISGTINGEDVKVELGSLMKLIGCPWCKKLEEDVFSDKEIIDYVNKNVYPVALDASSLDTIRYSGLSFYSRELGNKGAGGKKPLFTRSHSLVNVLLDYRLAFPVCVFLNQDGIKVHIERYL